MDLSLVFKVFFKQLCLPISVSEIKDSLTTGCHICTMPTNEHTDLHTWLWTGMHAAGHQAIPTRL